jgi:hypothetical protein
MSFVGTFMPTMVDLKNMLILPWDIVKGAVLPLGITAYTEAIDDFDATIGSRDAMELAKKRQYAKKHPLKSKFVNALQFLYSPSGIKLITTCVVMPLMFYFAVYSLPVLCVIAGISALSTARSIYKDGRNLRKLKKQQTEALCTKKIADLKNIQGILLKKFPQLLQDLPHLQKETKQIHQPFGFNPDEKGLKPGNRLTSRALPDAAMSFFTAVATLDWLTIGLSAFANLCNARMGQKEQQRLVKLQAQFDEIRENSKEQAHVDFTPGKKGNNSFLKQRLSSELSLTKTMLEIVEKNHPNSLPPDFKETCQSLINASSILPNPIGSTAHYAKVAFIKGMNPYTDYETLSPLAKYEDLTPFNSEVLENLSDGIPLRSLQKSQALQTHRGGEIEMQDMSMNAKHSMTETQQDQQQKRESFKYTDPSETGIEMINLLQRKESQKTKQETNDIPHKKRSSFARIN